MSSPITLIAGREFRAYVTTTSFWFALALGPLLTGGGMLLAQGGGEAEAARLELATGEGGALQAQFSGDFPLSSEGRAAMLEIVRGEGHTVRAAPTPAASEPVDRTEVSRFLLTVLLWVTLVGSLGMLLQAVVRERANRALEILLSAARPRDIVLGKVLGVGAVSVLVVATWLAVPVAMAALAPKGGAFGLLAAFADPAMMVRAAVVYPLAFAFYGFLTVMVGTWARDSADAQNLSRPLFAVLLAAFFATMSATTGAGRFDWLVYLPPFTPFMVLSRPMSAAVEVFVLVQLLAATLAAGWGATEVLRRGVSPLNLRWSKLMARKRPARDY
jgi:ABC-type Na+ efflux pump permease subunit